MLTQPHLQTFIFVRPPPAKTNHPLNLQVQLIPPNSRGPSGLPNASRQSLDLSAANSVPSSPTTTDASGSSAYEDGAPLSRSSSNASSTYSRSSSASTYSAASTSSSASSRRMIVPLYNLQAHNVMTNTIVDAGTDAKIAKFSKRGIEMLDLAVLEPVEVYAGGGAPVGGDALVGSAFSNKTVGGRPSVNLQVPAGNGTGHNSRPGTPDPSATTNSSQASLVSSSVQSSHASQTSADKKNLFGKLFKRKEEKDSPTPTPTPTNNNKLFGHSKTPSISTPTPLPVVVAAPRTSIGSVQRSSIDIGPQDHHQTSAQIAATPAIVGHGPILGVLPSVSSPVHPPKGRPGLYVWVVKRWMKGDGGGLLSVAKGMVKGHQDQTDVTQEVEVRFEWKRGKGKGKKAKKDGEDRPAARRQGSVANLGTANAPTRRLSMNISRQSSFSNVSVSEEGHVHDGPTSKSARRRSLALSVGQGEDGGESGDESDPEDSETPWTCTVKVRRLASHLRSRSHLSFHHHSREPTAEVSEDGVKKEVLKVKVGTLSPTPHHPKVVAMLKVPFPLPDVNVEQMKAEKRETSGQGGSLGAPKGAHTLTLTAEEIKDVVCSTGLWLVVREGFGGIGKVSRKGDGWRIRG
ncbi:hypothetical protein MIND_00972000 [Mycena indigotica]|uniref:Uncharacterized protein n=1 Tax=Mycena indigotica TaxID=2126181 RepID=A0A8H6SGG0_9AGAR|nr:uncharacterized protein MIND_00972000 [Mycena indigotica]KAF7297385.1 hypothetical protein MIND_00972000 [Mycena indigotica]